MRGRLTFGAALVVAVLVTDGVSAQVPHYGTPTMNALRVNSTTNPVVYYTDADLATLFGPTWNAWWCANSYGQFGCAWNVRIDPVQTLNDTASPVDYNNCADRSKLTSPGRLYLTNKYGDAAFVTTDQVLLLPGFNCGGTIATTSFVLTVVTRGGQASSAVFAHEAGHALGLVGNGHAHAEHCDATGCTVTEEGWTNTYSFMGYVSGFSVDTGLGLFSALDKARLGWLTFPGFPVSPRDASRPRIVSMSQPGDCVLEPLERPLTPTGIVACAVSINGSPRVTLEARVNGDKSGNNPGVVFVQDVGDGTLLRDLARTSGTDDYSLDPGQSVTLDGVTFTTLSFSQSGGRVRVSIAGSQPPPTPCGEPSCKPGKPGKPSIR